MAGINGSRYRSEILRLYREGLSAEEISEYLKSTRGVSMSPESIKRFLERYTENTDSTEAIYKYNEVLEEAERQLLEVDMELELKRIVLEARELRRLAVAKIGEADKPREVEVWSRLWSFAAGEIAKIYKLTADKKPIKDEKVWNILKQMVEYGSDE